MEQQPEPGPVEPAASAPRRPYEPPRLSHEGRFNLTVGQLDSLCVGPDCP